MGYMKNKNPWQIYFIYITLFFVLNILNTYVLTIQELNRYIAPFRHSFLGEINAFLGNFSILFLINTVFFIFIKKARSRMFFFTDVYLVFELFHLRSRCVQSLFWHRIFDSCKQYFQKPCRRFRDEHHARSFTRTHYILPNHCIYAIYHTSSAIYNC